MAYGVRLEVWGDYALFTRPEMKVERVSYDVMTPSAARGLLEAIYWHPGILWHIDRIHVLSPIRFTNIRRNEISSKIKASDLRRAMNGGSELPYINTKEDIQQRASMVLKDVHYVIEAHFALSDQANSSDNVGKFTDILRRRIEKGQTYHQPCFGCREFPAHFRFWPGKEIPVAGELYEQAEKDLGFMLYDMDYSDPENIRPQFFRAILRKGILHCDNCEVYL